MEAVHIKALNFCYNTASSPALTDITLSVGAGELVMLMGSSGSGKTTLLRLMKPETSPLGRLSGEMEISQPRVGYLPQHPEDGFVSDTVRSEILFAPENAGISPAEVRRLAAETISRFGIGRLLSRPLSSLSGGEKQLVSLCSVMVMQPEILLLDEPFSRLDPVTAESFASLILRVNREFGTTIIVAEHSSDYLFADCDRVLFLENGRLAADLAPRSAAGHPALHDYLPAAARCFSGHTPLTVREGREMLNALPHAKEVPLEKSPVFEDVLLTADDLRFSFSRSGEDILDGTSLTLHKGEMLSVTGANGCGKTTLLRVLAGLLRPYSGRVLYGGKPLKKSAVKAAMLPQEVTDLFLQPTVIEDYRYALKAMGKPESAAAVMLEKLGCSHLADMHPYDLSGGEAQLCGLGRVLLCDPQILLLDEPTKGLDPVSSAKTGRLLRTFCDEGMAVLTVTHDLDFAAEFSHTCALFCGGRIESLMPTPEFFAAAGFYSTAVRRIARDMVKNAFLPKHLQAALGGETDD